MIENTQQLTWGGCNIVNIHRCRVRVSSGICGISISLPLGTLIGVGASREFLERGICRPRFLTGSLPLACQESGCGRT